MEHGKSLGIIGNGSWGTALAKILTDNHLKINWWMRDSAATRHLLKHHHNQFYLTSVDFDPQYILPDTDLKTVIHQSDYLVIAIPSAYVADILAPLPQDIFEGKIIISAIKGILPQTHELLNDFLVTRFGMDIADYLAITGPCHAEEVAQERLSYLTFSGLASETRNNIARQFQTNYIITTTNHDLWGAQYAAVLKNIYAIGAGVAHGLGYGDNFLSVYITNCYGEMHRFLEIQFEKLHPSGEPPDFHISAYLGDLLVTCYSPHSRNRFLGSLLGKGYSIKAAMTEMNMVAEGYYASKGMQKILKQLSIQLPIAQLIHDLLWSGKKPQSCLKQMEQLLS